ncbi:MAG TPA: hypothetical protein VF331_02105 [Polyangiales bacterium]
MAITYVIEQGVLRTTVDASFALAEVFAYRQALLTDPAYRPGMRSLVDCRTVTTLPDAEQLRALAQDIGMREPALQRARCAVVVGSDAAYGLLRMYAVYTETEASPVTVRGFRELEAALQWLDQSA